VRIYAGCRKRSSGSSAQLVVTYHPDQLHSGSGRGKSYGLVGPRTARGDHDLASGVATRVERPRLAYHHIDHDIPDYDHLGGHADECRFPHMAGSRVPGSQADVDWQALRDAARTVAAHAYAPYSGLWVGAAGICEDGRLVTGCNVENASFGLTLCAECSLVSAVVSAGAGRLVAVSVTDGGGRPLSPCGRCRQLLMEQGGPELLLDYGPGAPPKRLGELLPGAFDASELDRAAARKQANRGQAR